MGIPMPAEAQPDATAGRFGDGGLGDDVELDENGEPIWMIDRIASAEKVGNNYKIYIKWVGSDEISWRWRSQLVKETKNAQLLKEIEEAVNAARSRHNAERYGREVSSEDSAEEDDFEAPPPEAPREVEEEPNVPDLVSSRLRSRQKGGARSQLFVQEVSRLELPMHLLEYYRALQSEYYFRSECVVLGDSPPLFEV